MAQSLFNRRLILASSLGLIAYCKKQQDSAQPSESNPQPISDKKTNSDTKSPQIKTPTESKVTEPSEFECKAQTNAIMPLELIPQAPESLQVRMQLYGSRSSAILGFTLPTYIQETTPLNSIYLCNETGVILAQKGFSAFRDLAQNQSFIPMALSHLNLESCKSLCFIFVLSSQKTYQLTPQPTLEFQSTFQGKPIVTESKSMLVKNLFLPNTKEFYLTPEQTLVRPDQKQQVLPMESFREAIVTDMAGQVISPLGEEFTDILTYPFFVTFYPRTGYYLRNLYWAC